MRDRPRAADVNVQHYMLCYTSPKIRQCLVTSMPLDRYRTYMSTVPRSLMPLVPRGEICRRSYPTSVVLDRQAMYMRRAE